MRTFLVVTALVVAMAAPLASAQFPTNGIQSCGDMELFIANPDMRDVASDNKYHVAGDFYMQFQVQGEGASNIESFGFSVGLPPENPDAICQTPEPLPMWAGFMLESYKADFDKSDGFFILMSTTGQSTPQHTDLTVSVHAYDGAGTEQARFWTTAVVESCGSPTQPVVQGGCSDDDVIANDNLQPWPLILPGDGEQDHAGGLYIDFAEPLTGLAVHLNGDDITAELNEASDADRKLWDDDTIYDHGPIGNVGVGSILTNPCEPPQACKVGDGPAYTWTERKMTSDDVVRVEAIDRSGNIAVKEIHMATAAFGGAVEGGIPILEMTFAETSLTGMQGDDVTFHMTMENTGSGEGHPFTNWQDGDYPAEWEEPLWDPGHEPVPPKGSSNQALIVSIPADAAPGTYKITPRMDYSQAGRDASVQSAVNVIVEEAEVDPNDLDGDGIPDDEAEKESSAAGIILAAVALLGVAAVRRK